MTKGNGDSISNLLKLLPEEETTWLEEMARRLRPDIFGTTEEKNNDGHVQKTGGEKTPQASVPRYAKT